MFFNLFFCFCGDQAVRVPGALRIDAYQGQLEALQAKSDRFAGNRPENHVRVPDAPRRDAISLGSTPQAGSISAESVARFVACACQSICSRARSHGRPIERVAICLSVSERCETVTQHSASGLACLDSSDALPGSSSCADTLECEQIIYQVISEFIHG